MFPAARGVNEDVDATDIVNTEHLMQYVFEMTKAKVVQLKEQGGISVPRASLQEEIVKEVRNEEEEERDGDVYDEEVVEDEFDEADIV